MIDKKDTGEDHYYVVTKHDRTDTLTELHPENQRRQFGIGPCHKI